VSTAASRLAERASSPALYFKHSVQLTVKSGGAGEVGATAAASP
jgi:hypothetical protein